jgi:hypothetical protein
MVELNITEDMKSKGPVEATFWPGIKVGNIYIRLRVWATACMADTSPLQQVRVLFGMWEKHELIVFSHMHECMYNL